VPEAYVNGYRPFQFADFSGGLNLRDKSDAVGDKEAIDLLNVTFTDRGAIRQRDGYADLTPDDLTNRVDSLAPFYTIAGVRQMIAGCGNRLEAINSIGAVVASATGLGGGPYDFERFADPTHEWLYAANGIDTVRRWDGVAWTAPTATVNGAAGQAMPRAGALAVTAVHAGAASGTNASNRLVATAFGAQTNAGPGGAATTPSRVYVSNAGQPEVWETDGAAGPPVRGRNFFDLTPGDGEQIMAAVTWRELVVVFKETKFFILWGEGTNIDATPSFQIREVVNNVGCAGRLLAAAGRDGVYFLNRRGVYRTTGNDPTLLSDIIDPLWTGDPEVYYGGDPINLAEIARSRLIWHEEQLYVAVPTGSRAYNDRLLVYSLGGKWWTVHDIAASALAAFRRVNQEELHHGYATGPQRVGRHNPGSPNDRDQPITARWRSGWSDYNNPSQKTFRENKVWGSGAARVSFSIDFNRTLHANVDTLFGQDSEWPLDGSGVTWDEWLALNSGRWPGAGQVAVASVRTAVQGTVFSTQFSSSPQASSWSVHRITRHLREVRGPSVR
jgi:hypothetical protein